MLGGKESSPAVTGGLFYREETPFTSRHSSTAQGHFSAKCKAKPLQCCCFRKCFWTYIINKQPFLWLRLSPLSSLAGRKQSAFCWQDMQHFKYLCLLLFQLQSLPQPKTLPPL